MKAFVFPGQGAQVVGMGKDFYENFEVSKQVFDTANKILGKDIESIYEPTGCDDCLDGYKGRTAIHEVLLLNQEMNQI